MGTALRRAVGRLLAAGAIVAPVLALAAGAEPEGAQAPPYEFGRGLRLGDSGLTLGGYLTGEVQRPRGGEAQWRLSHASVFLWWEPAERLKAFAEVDQENVVARRRGERSGELVETAERRASLERLHLDWTLDDALVLRGGKFLTPVGRWNLVHADPLVWTTSRPLLTQQAYPHNVTGLMASGQPVFGGTAVSYSFYASNGTEWDPDPQQDPFSTVRGGRVVVQPMASGWQIGASYARYRQEGSRGEPRTLSGLDVLWSGAGWELSAEWLETRNVRAARSVGPQPSWPQSGGPQTPGVPPTDRPGMRQQVAGIPTRGHYLQAVAPLAGSLYAVARVERIRDALADATLRQSTAGLAWRPTAAVSLKLEYQRARFGAGSAPQGWLASASVLF